MTCLRLCCCSNAFGRSDIDIRIFIELFLFFFFFTKSKIPSPQFQLKRKHRNSDSVPVNRGLVEYQRLFNVARIPRASKQRRKRCLRATWRDVRHQSVVFGRGGHDRSIGREKEEKKKRKKRVNSSFMQGCARVREAKGTLVARFEPRRASSSLVASVSCVRQQHVNNFTRLFHPVSGIRALSLRSSSRVERTLSPRLIFAHVTWTRMERDNQVAFQFFFIIFIHLAMSVQLAKK